MKKKKFQKVDVFSKSFVYPKFLRLSLFFYQFLFFLTIFFEDSRNQRIATSWELEKRAPYLTHNLRIISLLFSDSESEKKRKWILPPPHAAASTLSTPISQPLLALPLSSAPIPPPASFVLVRIPLLSLSLSDVVASPRCWFLVFVFRS